MAAIAACAAASPALAAPGWTGVVDVTGGGAQAPVVATDANGNTAVAWRAGNGAVQFAARPAGAAFGPPVSLSGPDVLVDTPAIAANAAGQAVVAWAAETLGSGAVRIDVATGSVAEGVQVTASVPPGTAGAEAGAAQVGVDATGAQTLAWLYETGDDVRVRVARRAGNGEPFALVGDLTTAGVASDLRLTTNAAGGTLLAWTLTTEETAPGIERVRTRIQVAALAASGAPDVRTLADVVAETDVEEDVTTGQSVSAPAPALDAGGGSGVAWRLETLAEEPDDNRSAIQAGVGSGAAIGGVATLSAAGQDVSSPSLSFNDQGVGILAWAATALNGDGDPVSSAVVARARGAGGGFGPLETVVEEGDPAERSPLVALAAVTPAGEGVVVFTVLDASGAPALLGTARSPLGGFAAPQPIGSDPNVDQVALAADAQGNVVTAWQADRTPAVPSSESIHAAAYDAAPPQVRALAVPSAGRVGEPLRFSVSAVDAWSPPVSARWSLGDGRSADGLQPQVTYQRESPRYDVTATVTDARGISATTEPRVLSIGAAGASPPAPPPPAAPESPPAVDPAPVLRGLRPVRRCVRGARLDANARRGGLAFRFSLSEPARVTFRVLRRRESPPRADCPKRPYGTQPGTVRPVAVIPRDAPTGDHETVLGRASARRPAPVTRASAGVNRVRLAAALAGRKLRPGTYILRARATDAAGRMSASLRTKFWVLKPPRAS